MRVSAEPGQEAGGSLPDRPPRWLRQTAMTDPGSEATSLDGLSGGIGALCGVVQGALIHMSWISAYDLTQSDLAGASRQTLPLSDRLRRLAATTSEPLERQRPPEARLPGTCRDFAVMLCGLLRHKGIPARVRCGFAAYFYEGPLDLRSLDAEGAPLAKNRLATG